MRFDPCADAHHNQRAQNKILQLTAAERPRSTLRDYGIGAQILLDLGVRDMILLSNHPRTIVGIEGYGLNIVDQRPLDGL